MNEVFVVALLCGICSLDTAAMFQVMVSRPLAVGILAGLLLRSPAIGLASGCLIELLWLGNLPVGSVVPPDFTLASCLAASLAILLHRDLPQLGWEPLCSLTVLLAIPVAWAGGWADLWQRRKSALLAAWVERRLDAGDESALPKAVALSLAATFFRGFALALLGLLLLKPALGFCLQHMGPWLLQALGWLYWLSLLLGFTVLLDLFWERRWLKVAALSFAASAIAAYEFHLGGAVLLGLAVATGMLLAVLNELRLRRGAGEA